VNEFPLDQRRAIDEFAEIAKEYCQLIEKHPSMKAAPFVVAIESLLPSLYLRALALPSVEPSATERKSAAEAGQWNQLYKGLKGLLKDYDLYYTVFDPADGEDHESITATLSDDLADIYRDLQDGFAYWLSNSTTGRADAAWEWKYGFESHWGRHLTKAIAVVFSLIHDHYIGEGAEGTA